MIARDAGKNTPELKQPEELSSHSASAIGSMSSLSQLPVGTLAASSMLPLLSYNSFNNSLVPATAAAQSDFSRAAAIAYFKLLYPSQLAAYAALNPRLIAPVNLVTPDGIKLINPKPTTPVFAMPAAKPKSKPKQKSQSMSKHSLFSPKQDLPRSKVNLGRYIDYFHLPIIFKDDANKSDYLTFEKWSAVDLVVSAVDLERCLGLELNYLSNIITNEIVPPNGDCFNKIIFHKQGTTEHQSELKASTPEYALTSTLTAVVLSHIKKKCSSRITLNINYLSNVLLNRNYFWHRNLITKKIIIIELPHYYVTRSSPPSSPNKRKNSAINSMNEERQHKIAKAQNTKDVSEVAKVAGLLIAKPVNHPSSYANSTSLATESKSNAIPLVNSSLAISQAAVTTAIQYPTTDLAEDQPMSIQKEDAEGEESHSTISHSQSDSMTSTSPQKLTPTTSIPCSSLISFFHAVSHSTSSALSDSDDINRHMNFTY